MVPLYLYFSRGFKESLNLDFSDDMLYELYESESFGGQCSPLNGYYTGKKWMSVTIAMWKEDLALGSLFPLELYRDPELPHWWLDRVLSKPYSIAFKQAGLI